MRKSRFTPEQIVGILQGRGGSARWSIASLRPATTSSGSGG
jgi:hypothetical protein